MHLLGDGDLVPAGNRTKAEYTSALKLIQPKTPLWRKRMQTPNANAKPDAMEVKCVVTHT